MGKSHRIVLIAIFLVTSGSGCLSLRDVKERGPRASFQNMIARMETSADTLAGPRDSRREATPKFREKEALPDEVTRTKSLLEVMETFRTRSAQRAEVVSMPSAPASPIPAPSPPVAPQAADKAPSDSAIASTAAPADALPGPGQDAPRSQQEAAPEVRKEEAMPDEEARTKSLREASAQQAEVVSNATLAAPPVPAESPSLAPESADKALTDEPVTPAAVPPATPVVTPSPDRIASLPTQGERILEDGAYRIGPEDVLHVTVWDNKDLTREVTVRPDGKISLPLIQDVQAQGLTASELASLLSNRLTEFIKDSQVSVIVTQVNAPKIYVLGNVQRPGPYPLRSDMSVLQALAGAGGFTPFASRKNIKLIRGTGDRQEVRRVNYNNLIGKGGDVNYLLKPGDTIVVP